MHRFSNILLSLSVALLVAAGTWLSVFACECHEGDCKSEPAACACDCACCIVAGAEQPDRPEMTLSLPLPVVARFPIAPEGDSGRLIESFIFTPPRA